MWGNYCDGLGFSLETTAIIKFWSLWRHLSSVCVTPLSMPEEVPLCSSAALWVYALCWDPCGCRCDGQKLLVPWVYMYNMFTYLRVTFSWNRTHEPAHGGQMPCTGFGAIYWCTSQSPAASHKEKMRGCFNKSAALQLCLSLWWLLWLTELRFTDLQFAVNSLHLQ